MAALSDRDKNTLKRLDRLVKKLGYKDFDAYYSSKLALSKTLKEIADELDIGYTNFTRFLKASTYYKRETSPKATFEDFKKEEMS